MKITSKTFQIKLYTYKHWLSGEKCLLTFLVPYKTLLRKYSIRNELLTRKN